MTEEIHSLFKGKATSIVAKFINTNLQISVRVGMATLEMPMSVFLELEAGTSDALEKIKSLEKLE